MNTKIYLIRHAETIKNKENRIMGGNSDSDLSELGLEQSNKTAEYISTKNPHAFYTSDLGRSYSTTLTIAEKSGGTPVKTEALRECSLGDWSDMPKDELFAKWDNYRAEMLAKGERDEDIRPPHGENTYDHRERVMRFIETVAAEHAGETIVIVAHAGTNKVALGAMRNLPIDQYYDTPQDNCCINEIDYDADTKTFTVLSVNQTTHLA
jgi:broad specificity phosphatase PhoE